MLAERTTGSRSAQRDARHLTAYSAGVLDFWRGRVKDPLFVYLISQTIDDGHPWITMYGPSKIGFAQDPVARAAMLQCGNPEWLVIDKLILGTPEVERYLHRHWHDSAIRGEWFDDSAGDIASMFNRIDHQQREGFDPEAPSPRHVMFTIPMLAIN